jgi:hypothetical protein
MAAGDTMTFVINDGSTGGSNPNVQVTITENADGTLTFKIEQLVNPAGGSYIGDLQGFYFDFPNGSQESQIGQLSATDQSGNDGDYTQNNTLVQGNDSVNNLGGGVNMNGLADSGFDAGIRIGTSGVGTDDVRSFEFTLGSNLGDLTLADFANVTFGVRLTSVGQVDGDGDFIGDRTGSSKISETTFDPNFATASDETGCVDEGTTFDGNVLDNDDGSTGGDDDIPDNLVLTSVKVDANGDGDFLDDGEVFDFTALDTSNTWDLGGTGATLTINADGSYEVDASATDVASDFHQDFNVDYTVQKTFFEQNGSVAGTSTETANLEVEICGTDLPPPPPGGGEGSFPEWPQDISHIVLYFDASSGPESEGDSVPSGGDGYYLVKIDGVPGDADQDLDEWLNDVLAYLETTDPSYIDAESDLLGVVIKGGNVDGSTQFYAYGAHNLNGDAADSIPAGAPTITTPPDQGIVDGNLIDETYGYAEIFT